MILMGAILGIIAMTLGVSMLFLVIFWSTKKSLKSLLFQKRLHCFVSWSSLLLVAFIIINAMLMRLNGANASLFMLIPALGIMFFGFKACGVLRRNFIYKIKKGLSCTFVISSFTTKEVYGYAIVEDVWFEAIAEVHLKRIASLKEEQQITAVIWKACPDDITLIVRF